VHTIWDPGHKHTAIWFVQFIGQEIRLIDFYIDGEGIGIHEYALMLQNKRYVYGTHYAPWDVASTGPNGRSMQTGRDFVEVARDAGIEFEIVDKCSINGGIQEVQSILDQCWFDAVKCDYGIRCLEMYRAKWDESAGCYEEKPLKNWACHGSDAFRYLAIVFRCHSVKGERVGQTKQTIPVKSGHSAYKKRIRRLA
jgi:phage terminase large subunit